MWGLRAGHTETLTGVFLSTQPPTTVDATTIVDSEIEAEVSWTVHSRPPEVVLSFQGLHEPTAMFDDLRAIGWDVPGMPPRPANAIEWTPDPVAGTDFTVLPWTVQEFRLGEGTWTVATADVGTRTLDALRNHHAKIVGTSEQIAEHAASYAERANNPIQASPVQPSPVQAVPVEAASAAPAAAPVPEAVPLTIPDAAVPAPADTEMPVDQIQANVSGGFRTVILLGVSPADDPLPGAGVWIGVSGRKKTRIYWNEQSIPVDQPIPGHQSIGTLVSGGASAWYAETEVPLPETATDGRRIVRLVVPDMSINDKKLRRLDKVLGDDLETFQLRSLAGANESAALVNAVIGAHAFDMLMSNLTLRMPNAIVRTQT